MLAVPGVKTLHDWLECLLLHLGPLAELVEFLANLIVDPVVQRPDDILAGGTGVNQNAQRDHNGNHTDTTPFSR